MTRSAEVRAARAARRRETGAARRLAVDTSRLDQATYVYRYVRDAGTRVQVLTEQEDYEVAPEGDRKVSGVNEDGSRETMVLMRKSRELHDDDKAVVQAEIDDEEARIREGRGPGTSDGTYVPKDTPIEISGRKTVRA